MRKYAQLLYGEVIQTYESELKKEDLIGLFGPNRFWIDVTGTNVETGYRATLNEKLGIVLTPPPKSEPILGKLKKEKIMYLECFIRDLCQEGVKTKATGRELILNTDMATQMSLINILTFGKEEFNEQFPNGWKVYGRKPKTEELNEYFLRYEQIKVFRKDLLIHLAKCKELEVKIRKTIMEDVTDPEELDRVIYLPDELNYDL